MITYSYYKMYKYITILEKRINCMEENDSTRPIYIKEDKAEGTISLADIGTSTEGGFRGYKIMLITMINNCNDDDINTLINLYIQIISMIKNIYTKFSELYMQKN